MENKIGVSIESGLGSILSVGPPSIELIVSKYKATTRAKCSYEEAYFHQLYTEIHSNRLYDSIKLKFTRYCTFFLLENQRFMEMKQVL